MKRVGLMSLIASAMLFVAFGVTTVSAEEGMGKCGKANKSMMEDDDRGMRKSMMDDDDRGMMKGDGKCGKKKEKKMKKDTKKSMKCGAGKCGS